MADGSILSAMTKKTDAAKPKRVPEAKAPPSPTPPLAGAIALVGAWGDLGDAVIDAFVADVYAARSR